MDQRLRDYYAWYATRPFLPYFVQAMGMRNAGVELILHEPVIINSFDSRKACAEYYWNQGQRRTGYTCKNRFDKER